MRLIGQLPSAAAETFARYLHGQSIECLLESVAGAAATSAPVATSAAPAAEIWVYDEDQVDTARALFSRYLSMPSAPEFARLDAPPAALPRAVVPEAIGPLPSSAPPAATADGSLPRAAAPTPFSLSLRDFPWGTFVLLVLVTCAWFSESFQAYLAFDLDALQNHSQLWRLFTSVLLGDTQPGGGGFVLFAALWILHFGRHLERDLGHAGFCILVLLTAGMATGLTQYVFPWVLELSGPATNPPLAQLLAAVAHQPSGPATLALAFYVYWLARCQRRTTPALLRRQVFLPGTHFVLLAILALLLLTPATRGFILLYLLAALPALVVALIRNATRPA